MRRSTFGAIRGLAREMRHAVHEFWIGNSRYEVFRGMAVEAGYVLVLTGVVALIVVAAYALAGR